MLRKNSTQKWVITFIMQYMCVHIYHAAFEIRTWWMKNDTAYLFFFSLLNSISVGYFEASTPQSTLFSSYINILKSSETLHRWQVLCIFDTSKVEYEYATATAICFSFSSNPNWLFPHWNHNLLNTFSWCDRAERKKTLIFLSILLHPRQISHERARKKNVRNKVWALAQKS